jgi:hypothetical protein
VAARAVGVHATAGCVPFGRERSSLPMRRVSVLRSLQRDIYLFVKRRTLLTSNIITPAQPRIW